LKPSQIDNEKSKNQGHFSNSAGFNQHQKNEMSNFTTVATLSTNRNPLDKENNYNPEAAIRLYKNKLAQEMPELVKDPYEQDISMMLHDRSSQNLSLNDLGGGHFDNNKSIEKLQGEFNQLKRDLRTELQNMQVSSRRDTDSFTREDVRKSSRSQDNKYSSSSRNTALFTFKNQQEFRGSKRMTERGGYSGTQQGPAGSNKDKMTGTLKLQPFIYLRENYPEFPQSIIKIDLKELKNL